MDARCDARCDVQCDDWWPMEELRGCVDQTLGDLDASVQSKRAITLPNLLRVFDRRWSRVTSRRGMKPDAALRHAGRAWGRAAVRSAYR